MTYKKGDRVKMNGEFARVVSPFAATTKYLIRFDDGTKRVAGPPVISYIGRRRV